MAGAIAAGGVTGAGVTCGKGPSGGVSLVLRGSALSLVLRGSVVSLMLRAPGVVEVVVPPAAAFGAVSGESVLCS